MTLPSEIRFKLHCGPYHPPECKVGDKLTCVVRGEMFVVGFSKGGIRWPVGKKKLVHRGKPSVIVCGDLKRAVENEAGIAIAHHFGVVREVVWRWRRSLGVKENIGTQRLRTKALTEDPSRIQKLKQARGLLPIKTEDGQLTISGHAEKYIDEGYLRGRTPVHSSNRFGAMTGVLFLKDVTEESFVAFRRYAFDVGYSIRTIENTISEVAMLVKFFENREVSPGRRIKKKRPIPKPTRIAEIDKIFPLVPEWVQQWIGLSYWTCARLEDSLKLLREFNEGEKKALDGFHWESSKTGHVHRWPCPEWLVKLLAQDCEIPHGKTYCHLQDKLRAALTAACVEVGTDRILPKFIRQRGLTEWARADGLAGAIVHGSGLGVLNHYMEPLSILERHQYRVCLPTSFGAKVLDEDVDIAAKYAQLPPEAQSAVLTTINALQNAG